MREIHGPCSGRARTRGLVFQRAVRDDLEMLQAEGAPRAALVRGGAESLRHHSLRAAGAALGSRADRLPAWMRGRISLEGRSG